MKFLILALTSLFVSFMPLQAAYAQGTDGTVSAGCVTIEQVLAPEFVEKLKSQGGSYVLLKDEQAKTFLKAIETLVQKKAPFTVGSIIAAQPGADSSLDNILYFGEDGCIQNSGTLPHAFVETFVGRKS